MNTLLFYLWIYVIGGVSFIPLCAIVALAFIYYTSPVASIAAESTTAEKLIKPKSELDEYGVTHPEINYDDLEAGEFDDRLSDGVETYGTGWLTVTTEYYQLAQLKDSSSMAGSADPQARHSTNEDDDASLINADELDSAKSKTPSAYQHLYKFVKGDKSNSPSNAGDTAPDPDIGKNMKNVRKKNRYFAVLKHGNLFLYKDDSCKNVQHVIVLNSSMVSMWPRNLKEGELFSKRAAICILKKEYGKDLLQSPNEADQDQEQAPKDSFFIYTDYNHEKEDWYFRLIKATKTAYLPKGTDEDLLEPSLMAKTSFFKTKNMIDLIQTLNSSEGQLTTKWLNALMGRVFLGLHNTKEFHDFIKQKLEKKLIKIKKPGFLDDFQIEKINVGDGGPFLTFPKMKELSPEGNLDLELNMLYKGGLTIQIATKANITLGARFKTREVNLVLTVKLVKLAGRVLVRIKPPPSNRIWYSFLTMPEMDLDIEPVVSTRQLTYNVVTKMIGNKFKEAIRESLVMPYMDEFPIYNTENEIFRGGIWDKKIRQRHARGHNKPADGKSETLANDELLSAGTKNHNDDSSIHGLEEGGDEDGTEEYEHKSAPQKADTFPISNDAINATANAFSKIKHSGSFNSVLTNRSSTGNKFGSSQNKRDSTSSAVTQDSNQYAEEDANAAAALAAQADPPEAVPKKLIPGMVQHHNPDQTATTENVYEDGYSADVVAQRRQKEEQDEASSTNSNTKISKQMKKIFGTKNGSQESIDSSSDRSSTTARDTTEDNSSNNNNNNNNNSGHGNRNHPDLKLPDRQNISTSIKKIGKWYSKAKGGDSSGFDVEQVPDEIATNREKNMAYTPPEMIRYRREKQPATAARAGTEENAVETPRQASFFDPDSASSLQQSPNLDSQHSYALQQQQQAHSPITPDRSSSDMFKKDIMPAETAAPRRNSGHSLTRKPPPPPALPPRNAVPELPVREPSISSKKTIDTNTQVYHVNEPIRTQPTAIEFEKRPSGTIIQHRKSKSSISGAASMGSSASSIHN